MRAADPLDPARQVGFDVQVLVDQVVYAPSQIVRITVSATNHTDRWIEQHAHGWRRFELSIRDELHRVIAADDVHRDADTPIIDRWLPGQVAIWPIYWRQVTGPIVPAWSTTPTGPTVPAGRYRARVRWLAREVGALPAIIEADSPWFDIVER